MAAQNWTTAFEATPAGATDLISEGDDRIRELKETISTVIANDHEMVVSDASVVGDQGWHASGSAKSYVQSLAPTTRPDGVTPLTIIEDRGRLWVDSDSGLLLYSGSDGADQDWVSVLSNQSLNQADTVQFNSLTFTTALNGPLIEAPLKFGSSVGGGTSSDMYSFLDAYISSVSDSVLINAVGTQRMESGFFAGVVTNTYYYFSRAVRSSSSEIELYGTSISIVVDNDGDGVNPPGAITGITVVDSVFPITNAVRSGVTFTASWQ